MAAASTDLRRVGVVWVKELLESPSKKRCPGHHTPEVPFSLWTPRSDGKALNRTTDEHNRVPYNGHREQVCRTL